MKDDQPGRARSRQCKATVLVGGRHIHLTGFKSKAKLHIFGGLKESYPGQVWDLQIGRSTCVPVVLDEASLGTRGRPAQSTRGQSDGRTGCR